MSKRPNNKTTKCFAAVDMNNEVVSFFKKVPSKTNDGEFYGDLMFEYPAINFPKMTYQGSPYTATYNGETGEIVVKY